jgi:NADH-ubiquinone oxidoreductase chain 1
MTEHAAVVFVFFFLAEYGSIVLICILSSILFLCGYLLFDNYNIFYILDFIYTELFYSEWVLYYKNLYIEHFLHNFNSAYEGLLYGFNLGLKSAAFVFIFIWVRASFPRIRFDQLMAFCWTVLLPVLFALIILIPCVLYSFNILPLSISLF